MNSDCKFHDRNNGGVLDKERMQKGGGNWFWQIGAIFLRENSRGDRKKRKKWPCQDLGTGCSSAQGNE